MSVAQAKHITLPSSFSSGNISEWFVHFDICNGWDDETKALKLPTLLEGEALASWLELSEEQQSDFKGEDSFKNDTLAIYGFGRDSHPKAMSRRTAVVVYSRLEKTITDRHARPREASQRTDADLSVFDWFANCVRPVKPQNLIRL